MFPCTLIFISTALAGLPIDTDKWLPMQIDGVPISDVATDFSFVGSVNLVGDTTSPAGYWSIDEDEVFFRIRLADSPLEASAILPFSCFPAECAWGVLVETDTELTTYENILAIPDGADALEVWAGSGLPDADAEPDSIVHSIDDPWPSEHLDVSDAGSALGGSADVFVDFAVPRVWLGLSSDDATISAVPATAVGPITGGMDADLASDAAPSALATAWSDPIGVDSDGDGLEIDDEWDFGTDPQDPDTDDDGLNDKDEQLYSTDPNDADTDDDGLTDGEEVHDWGTSPTLADTDGDGFSDGDEITLYATDPSDPLDPDPSVDVDCDGWPDAIDPDTTLDPDADTDGDGLSNSEEEACGTVVCVPETDHDGDGINTELELALGFDACDPESPDTDADEDCDGTPDWNDDEVMPSSEDMDDDGISNDDEAACGGDPCVADEDPDGDGLSNIEERDLGSNPCDSTSPDTSLDEDCDGVPDYLDEEVWLDPDGDIDGDNIPNGYEVDSCGTDPCVVSPDPDGDGVTNATEATCQTDPCDPDTDADGQWDAAELEGGDCGPDTDGDGIHDAIDPDGQTTDDPIQPDDGVYGLSGGAFTGGGCNQASAASSLMLSILAALLVFVRRHAGALTLVLLVSASARADTINAQSFRTTQLHRTFLTIPDAVISEHGWSGSSVLSYTKDPLLYRTDAADRPDIRLLGELWSADIAGGYNFGEWAVGVTAPVHIYASGDRTKRFGAMGDISGVGLFTLLDRREGPVGLGFSSRLTLPTGNEALWLSQQTTSGAASIHMSSGSTIVYAATLGFEGMGVADLAGTKLGSRTLWGAGVHVPISKATSSSLELQGANHLADLSAEGAHPVEALAVGRLELIDDLLLSVGMSTALSRGVGSPSFRAFAGVALLPRWRPINPRPPAEQPPPSQEKPEPQAVPTEGLVQINVADSQGEPVVASVWFINTDTRSTTSKDGVVLVSLPPGENVLRVEAVGQAPVRRVLQIEAGKQLELLISLSPSRATIKDDRILIEDKVFFETGSAEIAPQSHDLLDEVALLLLDHPELTHVQVQGHTDSVGQAADNLRLSQDRAQAVVDHLIRAGVPSERLTATGKGESTPLLSGDTDDARAQNRRVEFHVLSDPTR